MAKGAPNHLDFHLDTTWSYITGSGYADPSNYRPLNYDGLPHDIFHILYYPVIYVSGLALSVSAAVLFFSIIVFMVDGGSDKWRGGS